MSPNKLRCGFHISNVKTILGSFNPHKGLTCLFKKERISLDRSIEQRSSSLLGVLSYAAPTV